MIVASRVEKALSKQEILEIYLNAIYPRPLLLGHRARGAQLFRQAGQGPDADRGRLPRRPRQGPELLQSRTASAQRAQERLAYVLGRMQEDGVIDDAQMRKRSAKPLTIATLSRPRRDNGYHIVDQIGREAQAAAGVESLTDTSYVVRSTIHPQSAAGGGNRAAGRPRPLRAEQRPGQFRGAEANLGDAIRKLQTDPKADRTKPVWQQALIELRPPLYDVHWTPAVVVEKINLKARLRVDPRRAARRPRAAAVHLSAATRGGCSRSTT